MKKHLSFFIFRFSFVIAVIAAITSCDVARQAQGAYNMVNCKYDFQSLTGVTVAGINPSNMTLMDAPRIISLLSGGSTQSIPVGFTVNLGVTNPNATDAILNGLDYVIAIDGIDFTSGSVAQMLNITPGGTGTLPLAMAFDVAALLKGDSRDAIVGVVRNLIGMGSEASKVTLNIRPSFNVGGYKVASPVMIPVSFSFGGK